MAPACTPKTDGTPTHHYLRRLLAVPGYARVYVAVSRLLGHPAVVHTYTRTESPDLPAGVEVLVYTGSAPRNLTVEVRHGNSGVLVDALEDAANLLRTVLPLRGVADHLEQPARPRVAPRSPPAWRVWAGPAALALGAVLTLWLGRAAEPAHQRVPHVDVGTPASMALADVTSSSTPEPMNVQRRLLMPSHPIPGQDVPPCGRGYLAINGGCWAKLEAKSPNCPAGAVEYKGGCYLPVKGAQPVPMSIDRGLP